MDTSTPKRAKLFATGGSQAVRLPAEFRFEAKEVYISRDPVTGDVVLSSRPRRQWQDFVQLRGRLGAAPTDFLSNREQPTQERDPFADWRE